MTTLGLKEQLITVCTTAFALAMVFTLLSQFVKLTSGGTTIAYGLPFQVYRAQFTGMNGHMIFSLSGLIGNLIIFYVCSVLVMWLVNYFSKKGTPDFMLVM